MGSIAGPIIRFRFDAPSAQQAAKQLSDTVGSTMAKASKSSAQQFVSEWQGAAAKLRASMTSEKLGLNQITQAREKIISLAERERAIVLSKVQLTKQDLSLLRSTTLEIEKQKNALEGFGAVTSPTRKIVQQMISGIGMRAGSYGGGMGSFAGIRVNESLGKMADEATGGKLALLGMGAAAVAITAAMIDMAKKGAELAVSLRNSSEAAGISIKSMVELKSASASLGIDSDVSVKMFKKFNQELTYAMGANLPHASIEAKRAAEVFQLLGVNIQKAAADPMEGFRELSQALSVLPEGAVKSATEVMLLGRGGQEAAPLINHLSEAIRDTKESSDALASTIGDAAKAGDSLATASANLANKWHELEMNLSTVFVPLLSGIIGLVNKPFDMGRFLPSLHHTQTDINGNPINVPAGISSTAAAAALSRASGGISLGSAPGAMQTVDVLNKLAGAIVSDATGTGKGKRGPDTALPLYLHQALKEFEEYQKFEEKLLKEYDEKHKKDDQDNSKNFAGLLERNLLTGSLGMGIYSPDKTGAGAKGLMDSLAEAANDAAKKAAEKIVDAWRQWRDEGKNLFETLLSGSHNFAKAFARDVENIALKPVQNAFGNLIGNVLYQLDKIVPNTVGGKGGAGGKGPGGWLGKVWQGIQKGISPPKGVQNAMETIQNAQITAANVYLTGPIRPTGTTSGSNFMGGGLGFLGMGNNSSMTSLAGVGGFSMALAAAGGTAIAGSGGAAVAGGGGMAVTGGTSGAGSVAGTATAAGAVMQKMAAAGGNGALGTIGAMIPGLALMGIGLGTRNGAATALGIGSAGAGLLGSLGSRLGGKPSAMSQIIGGAKLSQLSRPQSAGDWLNAAGSIVSGAGMMFAGNQTGGLGGAAMGALGGLQAGTEIGTMIMPGIGTAIGAVVGTIGGALMGAFGKKNNEAAWQNNVTRAQNNQRITLPPSENFAFASMGSMAQTMSTTFGQGPGSRFSNSTLAANTPFWANAILGTPRNTNAQIQWNALMNGLNTNLPFYGGSTNPFTGGTLPSGLRNPRAGDAYSSYSPNAGVAAAGSSSGVQVHFTVPGYVDKGGLADIVKNAAPLIHQSVSQSVSKQSSGMRQAMSRAVNLP